MDADEVAWHTKLAEHQGCACPERAPNGACMKWVKLYLGHIQELLSQLNGSRTGRG